MLDPTEYLQKTMTMLMIAALRGLPQKEQISELDRAGFGQKDIANILVTTPNNVGVRLAEIRKKAGTKKAATLKRRPTR